MVTTINLNFPNATPEALAALVSALIRLADTDTDNHDRLVRIEGEIQNMQQAVQDKITALQTSVTNLTTVEASAEALLTNIKGQLDTAIQDAKDQGATEGQLQSLTDLGTAIDTGAQTLTDSITANTPATA